MIGCYNNRDQNLRKMAKMRALKLAEEHNRSQNTNAVNNNRNVRNPSINNRANQPTGVSNNPIPINNNTQRGKSVVLNTMQAQVKPPVDNPMLKPTSQPNSSFSSKNSR